MKYKNKTQTYYPEDIASIILRKIKEINEAHIGKTINEAVIVSLPTSMMFNVKPENKLVY